MSQRGRRDITNTRWTIVLQAGEEHSPTSDEALATLYQTYWQSLYLFLRARGHGQDNAEELVQAFWLFLLERGRLRHASRERGRFRSFLLTSLKNFVINEHDRQHAEKRGGGVLILPLEIATAEGQFQIEPPTDETPDKVFDRRWALTVLERAFIRLREGMTPEKSRQFDGLKVHLLGDRTDGGYARTATLLGISEGAARTEVSRLRTRLRDLVEDEIAHTVSSPEEIEDEIRHLLAALSR
jgi:RNA polymerase sigma-70 factor (ECF subfamily)